MLLTVFTSATLRRTIGRQCKMRSEWDGSTRDQNAKWEKTRTMADSKQIR